MNEIQDRDKIKPYDATKYLRQMKFLPNTTPFCGILLILLIIFLITTTEHGIYIGDIPEAKYAHHEPLKRTPTIYIKKNGEIFANFAYRPIELNRLPTMIADYIEEVEGENYKVLLTVAGDTPWSIVRDVMDALKNSSIEVVGFVTETSATTLDYLYIQKMYREKGLKVPTSAK